MNTSQDSASPSPATPRGDTDDGSPTADMPVEEPANVALQSTTIDSAADFSQTAGSADSGHSAEPSQSIETAGAGISKGRPVAPTDAHVVVIQPDNEVNVGVNVDKCVHPNAETRSRCSHFDSSVDSRDVVSLGMHRRCTRSCVIDKAYALHGLLVDRLQRSSIKTGHAPCLQVGSLFRGVEETSTCAGANINSRCSGAGLSSTVDALHLGHGGDSTACSLLADTAWLCVPGSSGGDRG